MQKNSTGSHPLDQSRCPLCGQSNICDPTGDCWCFHTHIDRQALERIPQASRGKACLCPACAKMTDTDTP
ncbi:cysteine-rich CWC family protein [Stutzerimonas kirkiae]|uniref:DNA or RNA helicase of superfamily II n=1 Tax=Stutzerimonas kirkiae TaxID=2211392 RepID=A0A4Q9RE36_9GAMM|nr:cysteine-rich CWC family protein [Stutzerimonas kirkiae]TBU99840.1 DNA or RNA helicase of superfamily II [Stutzerimonas kirkiae]TBV05228.1 DNA or RNA helicase of superfamily II [Stutzerimonas kirkiae]TBV08129.1 DNA or RNA helicase of superfamily II [Stutzerimonas kirkiae]TBV17586.1 DNA or RNA helicase of superfamily II [Stutzerimonas kirkiae]